MATFAMADDFDINDQQAGHGFNINNSNLDKVRQEMDHTFNSMTALKPKP